MKLKKVGNYWIIRIDKGEEIVKTIKKVCEENKIMLGKISGIGAVDHTVIGLFNTSRKEFLSQKFTGDFEVTHLSGNITTMNRQPYLHLHIMIADENLHCFGGHLSSAIISGTGEVFIEEIDDKIDRKFDSETGLNLLFDE